MEGDLRSGSVDPAQKLVDVLGVGAVVLPVDLVGVGVPGIDRTGGTLADDGVDQHVEHVLTGTELRPVDRPGDAGAADDVGRSSAVDLDVAVDFADEVIHIGHHFDRAGDGEQLGVVRSVFDAVDAGVHVVPFDDTEQERGDVVGLDILELVDLRNHAVLRVVLDEPQFLDTRILTGGVLCCCDSAQQQPEGERCCFSGHIAFLPCECFHSSVLPEKIPYGSSGRTSPDLCYVQKTGVPATLCGGAISRHNSGIVHTSGPEGLCNFSLFFNITPVVRFVNPDERRFLQKLRNFGFRPRAIPCGIDGCEWNEEKEALTVQVR